MKHIDVRGPWPIYIDGARTVRLEGHYNRNMTIEEGSAIVARMDADDAARAAARPEVERGKDW